MASYGKIAVMSVLALGVAMIAAAAPKTVVVVVSRSLQPYQEALKGFEQDGRFSTQVINLEGDLSKASQIQSKIDNGKVEAVVVLGSDAVNAVKNTALALPLVYSMVLEPVELPGKKICGVIMQIPAADQFGQIAKMLPSVKKIGVLYNAQFSKKAISEARDEIGRFGMTLIPMAVENPSEVGAALGNMTKNRVDAIWSVVDNVVAQPSVVGQTIAHTQAQKIPFIGLSSYHVKAGALLAFSADYTDMGKQTAELTSKIISGTGAGKVESPHKIIVFVNETMQKQLGLDLSGFSDVQFIR